MDDIEKAGEITRALFFERISKDLTIREAARLAGISTADARKAERFQAISLINLVKYAHALGLSIEVRKLEE